MVFCSIRCGAWESQENWVFGALPFLPNSSQFVAVSEVLSSVSSVVSGVPRGSVLGSLLFYVHIHDTDLSITNSTATSFAGDTRITKMIILNKIYEWAV